MCILNASEKNYMYLTYILKLFQIDMNINCISQDGYRNYRQGNHLKTKHHKFHILHWSTFVGNYK